MLDLALQWLGNTCILLGCWLLVDKKKSSLVCFSLGNLCWITYGIHSHLWAIVVLDSILTVLNVKAWIQWSKG